MENAMVDWKNEDEKAPDDYDSDVVSWVFKKGLRLGKIVLVTGIVISSAPVVLPPLVVISAFGIAISVPYGVFLATYACTEKLMAFLLPKAVPPSMEECKALTYGNEDEEKDEQVKRTSNAHKMRWGFGEDDEIEETPRGEILEGNAEKQSGGTFEIKPKSIKEEDDEPKSIAQELVLKRDPNDENKSEIQVIPADVKEKKDQYKAKDIEIPVEPAKETQRRDKGRLKESEKQAKAKKLDQDVNNGVEHKGIASDAVLDKDMGPKVNEIVQVIERKTDKNIENTASPDKKPPHEAKNKKSPHEAKNVPKKGSKKMAQNGSSTSLVEVVYSEKKIWEEINNLRTIVGYKEPRLPSTEEELKALYLFTGIQPPASVKNPSDPAEFTTKLRFLMAIVGVN